jgi:hypothetical protein
MDERCRQQLRDMGTDPDELLDEVIAATYMDKILKGAGRLTSRWSSRKSLNS